MLFMLFDDNILADHKPYSLQLLKAICLLPAHNWAKEVLSNEQQCIPSFWLAPSACLIYSGRGLQHVALLNTIAYAAL
jgi:hypothetical protein